jgi:hypothetical protein
MPTGMFLHQRGRPYMCTCINVWREHMNPWRMNTCYPDAAYRIPLPRASVASLQPCRDACGDAGIRAGVSGRFSVVSVREIGVLGPWCRKRLPFARCALHFLTRNAPHFFSSSNMLPRCDPDVCHVVGSLLNRWGFARPPFHPASAPHAPPRRRSCVCRVVLGEPSRRGPRRPWSSFRSVSATRTWAP